MTSHRGVGLAGTSKSQVPEAGSALSIHRPGEKPPRGRSGSQAQHRDPRACCLLLRGPCSHPDVTDPNSSLSSRRNCCLCCSVPQFPHIKEGHHTAVSTCSSPPQEPAFVSLPDPDTPQPNAGARLLQEPRLP